MRFKPLLFVCLSAVCVTVAQADWGRDDTALLASDIKKVFSGELTRLPIKTYYVRGQIRMGQSGGDDSSSGIYHVPFTPYSGPLTLKGALEKDQVTGQSFSIPARLQTRIVHGAVVGDTGHENEIHSGVPTGDPWYSRFPNASSVCWIEFDEGGSGQVKDRTTYDPENIGPHKFDDFNPDDNRNWPTVTYKGIPLHIAEAVLGHVPDFPDYRWTRVDSGTQTLWEQSTESPYGGTQTYPGLFNVPSHNHSNDWTWGLTFHDWDANCAMARVASIEREEYSEGPVGGPLETTHRYVGVTFSQNPFSVKTGGSATLPDKKQRLTLMNAPEFLDQEGEMVFNPANGRIYFICPSAQKISQLPDTEANHFMEVAWPKVSNSTGKNWGSPLIIGKGDSDTTRQLTIENIMFGTGRGMSVDVQRMVGPSASEPVLFKNCKFRNQGFQGVNAKRCRNLTFDGCEFEDGMRGHLKLDAERDFTKPYARRQTSPPSPTLRVSETSSVTISK